MVKKNNSTLIILVFAVLAIILLINNGTINININKNQNNSNYNIDNFNESNNIHLCEQFADTIPTQLASLVGSCLERGGEYYCEQDLIGCFGTDIINESIGCSTDVNIALYLGCETIGGDYTCNNNEISCRR